MKIDLHVHTSERSMCANASETEQINQATQAGLDAIVITDHGRLVPPQQIKKLNELHAPFKIFTGIECGVNAEHILVIGIHDPLLETKQWTYPELHAFTKQHNGALVLAHPYRFSNELTIDIETYPVDGMEIYSSNTPPQKAERIFALAQRLNIPVVCDSDGHKTDTDFIGQYYNILSQPVATDLELVTALKQRLFTAWTKAHGTIPNPVSA